MGHHRINKGEKEGEIVKVLCKCWCRKTWGSYGRPPIEVVDYFNASLGGQNV